MPWEWQAAWARKINANDPFGSRAEEGVGVRNVPSVGACDSYAFPARGNPTLALGPRQAVFFRFTTICRSQVQ